MAQGEPDVVRVVLVLGITTQRSVEEVVKMVADGREPGIPVAVSGGDVRKDVLRQMAEVVSLAVALVLVIAQLVVCLQVSPLPKRLAVGGAEHIAAVVGRGCVVAGSVVGGVATGLVLDEIEVDVVVRGILVLAVASAGFDAEGYVASMRIQTAVELQHAPRILVAAIGEAGVLVVVDEIWGEGIVDSRYGHRCQRVVGIEIRVVVEGGGH